MKQLFLILFSLLPLTVGAQTVRFEVGGGLAKQFGHSRKVGSFKIGVAYEHEFDQHWSVAPGLFFYSKGWKDPFVSVPIVDLAGNPVYEPDGVTQRMGVKSVEMAANYLTLPVVFNYYVRLGAGRYLQFGAGPYAAYGIGGKRKIKGDTSLPGTQKFLYVDHTFEVDGAKRFDAGILLKCGYQFSEEFTAGIETDFGLLRTATGGARNVSALVTLTYRLHWGRSSSPVRRTVKVQKLGE